MRTHTALKKQTGISTYRGNAIAVGVLLILCSAAAILSGVPLGAPVGSPVDLAAVAANDDRVVSTALIEFVWATAGMGIAIGLYPVLRRSSPALALGSVVGRVVENVFILIGTLSLLALLTVSQQAAGSGAESAFQVSGDALVAVRDWVHELVAMIPFGIGSLLYNYVLFKARLVPRWLAGWGLIAVVMSMVAAVYAGFTQDFGFTTVNIVLSAPIGLQEMALAGWLIVKGFSAPTRSSVASVEDDDEAGIVT
ncbi:MAG TPA: DUF4386 domain-containing protein [Arachnia sp.]|nr:DUF4386 domain-containing protein [Arachnia sp.]